VLSHACGAVFDNPDQIALACVGDGAVLPVLHLNGYKIANPTQLARIPRGDRRGDRADSIRAGGVPEQRRPPASLLADDRAALPQGLEER